MMSLPGRRRNARVVQSRAQSDQISTSSLVPNSITSNSSQAETEATPTTGINAISDKELLSIFLTFPPGDILRLGTVCKRWQSIQQIAFRNVKTLRIIQKPFCFAEQFDIARYWYFNDFSTDEEFVKTCFNMTQPFTDSSILRFGALFPKVTSLNLYCLEDLKVEQFISLIKLWPQLHELTLFGHTRKWKEAYNCTAFWDALHSLTSLRILHLPFDADQIDQMNVIAPFMFRLHTLYYKTSLHLHLDTANLNENVTIKHFYSIHQSRYFGEHMIGFNGSQFDQKATNVGKYNLKRYGLYSPFFQLEDGVGGNFHQLLTSALLNVLIHYGQSLTHLDLELATCLQLAPFLESLSKLEQLTSLRITARLDPVTGRYALFDGLTRRNYRTKLTTVIRNLRELHLSNLIIHTNSRIFLYFQTIFPEIECLHIDNCVIYYQYPKWLMESLKGFPRLTRVRQNSQLKLKITQDAKTSNPTADRKKQHAALLKMVKKLYI